MPSIVFRFGATCALGALVLCAGIAEAQPATSQPAPAAQAEGPRDSLGRDTPRGTVLGFMDAARKGSDQALPMYLDTNLRGSAAVELARQLYEVLDSRLPARLNTLSDRREGSRGNPLNPDEDVIGTINTANGPLDLIVERVTRGASGPVWLFSRQTLMAIPDVHDEIDLVSIDPYLPEVLIKPRIAGIRLFEWLALVFVVPLLFKLIGLLSRAFRPAFTLWHRRFGPRDQSPPESLPGHLRLLLLAVVIRWAISGLDLPLLERQLWWGISFLFALAAVIWMALSLNAYGEAYFVRRFEAANIGEIPSLLRLGRRVADVIVIAAGGLAVLHYLGVDATAALAGLGIGGIAVALAAQKTLENVIGGLSLIFDKAVRVGDFLKLGETMGTVDYIGLRSTRIRTLDRTMLSVPNGQVATVTIETLSARDKFWFHHFVTLRYETTALQMRAVIEGVRDLLVGHPSVDFESIRVRFLRLGASSLDVEVFAYILARDWNRFLEIQEELLLRILEIVEGAGTAIAFPSQTVHFADNRLPVPVSAIGGSAGPEAALPGGAPRGRLVP